jgi:hypothetical protein
MSKIGLEDTTMDAITKVSDGVPGAVSVILQLMHINPKVDPQDFAGSMGPLFTLDSYGIYGSEIWMLYKDVCKQNAVHTLGMLRACQMGILPIADLKHAINNYGEGVDVETYHEKVRKQLRDFDKN